MTTNLHPPTPCCQYRAPLTMPYPVMWNEFNEVVQCHNCGHRYEPVAVDPHETPEYAAFVESMIPHCHCTPYHLRPCDGVLAGGVCDGIDWEKDDADYSEPFGDCDEY